MIRLKTFIVINTLTELIFKKDVNLISFEYFQKFLLETNRFRLPNHIISKNDLILIFDYIVKNNYLSQDEEGNYNVSRSKLSNFDYFYIFADKFQRKILFHLDNFIKFLYESRGLQHSQDYVENLNYGVLLMVFSNYNLRPDQLKEIEKLRFMEDLHKAFVKGSDHFIEYVKDNLKSFKSSIEIGSNYQSKESSENFLGHKSSFTRYSDYSIKSHKRQIVFDSNSESYINKYAPPITREDYYSKIKDDDGEDLFFDSDFEVDLGYLEDLTKK
jgi:hypothetical protein